MEIFKQVDTFIESKHLMSKLNQSTSIAKLKKAVLKISIVNEFMKSRLKKSKAASHTINSDRHERNAL